MIRRASASDLDDLLTLFANTIRFINSRDYNPSQIEAWLSSIHDRDRWLDKIKNHYFILYLEEDQVLGFASLDQGSYIDLLYVHHKRQGEGIAGRLLKELETEAYRYPGQPLIFYTNASITAVPFFQSKGFVVEHENEVDLRGVVLNNYRMTKVLKRPFCVIVRFRLLIYHALTRGCKNHHHSISFIAHDQQTFVVWAFSSRYKPEAFRCFRCIKLLQEVWIKRIGYIINCNAICALQTNK